MAAIGAYCHKPAFAHSDKCPNAAGCAKGHAAQPICKGGIQSLPGEPIRAGVNGAAIADGDDELRGTGHTFQPIGCVQVNELEFGYRGSEEHGSILAHNHNIAVEKCHCPKRGRGLAVARHPIIEIAGSVNLTALGHLNPKLICACDIDDIVAMRRGIRPSPGERKAHLRSVTEQGAHSPTEQQDDPKTFVHWHQIGHTLAVVTAPPELSTSEVSMFGVKVRTKRVPWEPVSASSSSAPTHAASCRLIARPMPLPPSLVDRQGLKRTARWLSGMPAP